MKIVYYKSITEDGCSTKEGQAEFKDATTKDMKESGFLGLEDSVLFVFSDRFVSEVCVLPS